MNLFKGLDSEKTKQAAKNTLEAYRFLKRVSGEKFSSKVTAVYSFEPRSYTGTVSNPIESHMVRQIAAQQRVDEIEQAINMMTEAFQQATAVREVLHHERAKRYRNIHDA